MMRRLVSYLLLCVFVLLASSARAQEYPYIPYLRERANGNAGLMHLANAMEQFETAKVFPVLKALDEINSEGWKKPYPEVLEALRSQGPALGEAVAAVAAPGTSLPPASKNPGEPVPNFHQLLTMEKLIAADGCRVLGAGDLAGARERALQTLQLARLFWESPDQPLVTRLVGLHGINLSLDLYGEILRHPKLTPEMARGIGSELFAADFTSEKLGEDAVRDVPQSIDEVIATLKMYLNTEGLTDREQMQKSLDQLSASADIKELDAQLKAYREALKQALSRPFYEQQPENEKLLADEYLKDPALKALIPLLVYARDSYASRAGVTLAKLHATMALSALRMGSEDTARRFIDPFSGQPLKITDTVVYSVGPDGKDQQGRLEYDPKAQNDGAGDIVVKRTP